MFRRIAADRPWGAAKRRTLPPPRSKPLVRPEIPPLPERQIAQRDPPDPHALEADRPQTHQLAHPPDLALLALGQHEAQLLRVLPVHLRRLERLPVQAQAVAQARELR